ncbi:MAG: hypothetical protein A3G20_09070 [Acidobacteria bacterium RIFCSPLOWO2_12_FULL_59_11]|nr:MAG: hypothetical protein A3G20_09070 [Acidobacteria bacterium RIFCSPLOWO2_12_FULL_59_11]
MSSTIWRKRENKLFQGCGIFATDEKTGNQPREPSQPRNSRSQKPEVRSQNEPNRKRGMGTSRSVRSGVPEGTERTEETEKFKESDVLEAAQNLARITLQALLENP